MEQEHSATANEQAEREELDAVAQALVKSPRLMRLLHYLGEKYFQGEAEHLREYNIATEVFGRSKTAFDAGEDAIARVEAHRLRKKLKDFYETEGRRHVVRISIPSGSYVPVFTHRAGGDPTGIEDGPLAAEAVGEELPEPSAESAHGSRGTVGRGLFSSGWKSRKWLFPILATALVATVLVLYFTHQSGAIANHSGSNQAQVQAAGSPPSAGMETLPIRIISGYSGKPQIDSAGQVWGPDRYFHSGGTWVLPNISISRTSDPMLFEQWRTGDFFYDIPLQPGVYELHLYFVTTDRAADSNTTFTVSVNGERVMPGFDVNSDALGENIADERILRDVSPDKDGYLHLAFTSERGAPALNALEILKGIPHKQLPIRLVTQLTAFTDHDGNLWHPDNYFMNGRLSAKRQQISGSPDPNLFAAERYGHFTYAIPVDTRGRYTLVLHFAEFYFGPQASGVGGTGSRLFRVMCNGVLILDDFDIYKEAGSLHALTRTFYHLKPSPQGKLNLTFEPIENNATISGIEVLDESQ
jgi:hypothetical protein